MKTKGIYYDKGTLYKKPSMVITASRCSGKCFAGHEDIKEDICPDIKYFFERTEDIRDDKIVVAYTEDKRYKALVFAGLEPFDSFSEMLRLIKIFRGAGIEDDIVIYTGYEAEEIWSLLSMLSEISNVIVKLGRHLPNVKPGADPVLGVVLDSENQHGELLNNWS